MKNTPLQKIAQVIKHCTSLMWAVVVCLTCASTASAMDFKAQQWQLVAFPYLPVDASIANVFAEAAATNGELSAVWTFDNNLKQWQSWPAQNGLATSDLTQLVAGQGYWVKTSSDLTIDLTDNAQTVGEMVLYPGWNLIGLAAGQTMGHEQALAGVPFLELWKYDSDQNKFLAVQKSLGSQIILKEEFTEIEPGQGLWVNMAGQSTLLPEMGTLLPPDVDIQPLLNLTQYGVESPWDNVTPGDVDWDEDGYFDFPNTQHMASFGDFLNRQRLSITNDGNGVLSWQATIEPAVDWLLFEAFDAEQNPVLTNFAVGNVSNTHGELILVANRTGMAPSDNYQTQIVLRANGSNQEKRIDVRLAVADVVGDYEMTVRLDNVNGKAADLHNPKYFLSFARDGQGVKAFLDEERSLLIPQTTYLSGDYIADPESHFQVLGQLYLPADHAHNPYTNDIRREFTIIGQRSDGSDGLSPLDLKGSYAENIYGIFDDPIQLTGEFVARRLSPTPKKKDQSISTIIQGDILAGSAAIPVVSAFDVNITDRFSITDLKAALSIDHTEPEALTLTLKGPQWIDNSGNPQRTTVILHQQQNRTLNDVRFDDYDPSVNSLDNYDGQLSYGLWTLEIANISSSVGSLDAFTLDISGAKVYKLTGTLADAGINIQISGCGIVRNATTNQSGYFEFDGLIPCDYEIKVLQLGYDITATNVRIIGCMQGDPCDTPVHFIQALDASQLAQLQPQLVTSAGAMRVIATPTMAMLPATIQAVDVTDYSSLGKTLTSRSWQLFKRPDATITTNDQLIDSFDPATLSGSWGVDLLNQSADAGSYYIKLNSNVTDNGTSQAEVLSYTTGLLNISFLNTANVHVGTFTAFGAAGSASIKAMDTATYDLDRFPLVSETGSQGIEDSDGFTANDLVDDAFETNAPIEPTENPPGVYSVIGDGLDQPAGNLNKHYRMYISAGQLYQGGSMYSGNFRLDTGIQSQEESK
jgi:subtilisin-like proprotein convertase family protein